MVCVVSAIVPSYNKHIFIFATIRVDGCLAHNSVKAMATPKMNTTKALTTDNVRIILWGHCPKCAALPNSVHGIRQVDLSAIDATKTLAQPATLATYHT